MDDIREQIRRGRLREALQLLEAIVPAEYRNESLQLNSRFNQLQTRIRHGVLTNSERGAERNSITIALLELLDNIEREEPTQKRQTSKEKIYFSYAWGTPDTSDDQLTAVVDQLYQSLLEDGYSVQRDSENIAYGGSISDYMDKLGAGNLIVVFVSDKYVRSPYCMFELHEIARTSQWDKTAFRTRILPIPLKRIRFDDPDILDQYFDYWEDKLRKWEAFMAKRSRQIKEGQSKDYHRVQSIHQNFGDLASWLTDINSSNLALLSENDFEMVKKAITGRLGEIRKS